MLSIRNQLKDNDFAHYFAPSQHNNIIIPGKILIARHLLCHISRIFLLPPCPHDKKKGKKWKKSSRQQNDAPAPAACHFVIFNASIYLLAGRPPKQKKKEGARTPTEHFISYSRAKISIWE